MQRGAPISSPCVLLAALVSGCGASPAREVVVPPSTDAVEVSAEPPVDACAGQSGLVLEVPEEIPGEFDGALITGGHATAIVRWCGAGTVAVRTMTVIDDDEPHGSWLREYGDDGVLAHGAELRTEISAPAPPRAVAVTVVARASDASELTTSARVRSAPAARYV